MKKEILNKLTKKGREEIILLEGRLRELDEDISEIDNQLNHIDEIISLYDGN
jgi:hypothetical protein